MECESIMDISMNLNTIDDISAVNEVSMEISTVATPMLESWSNSSTAKIERVDPFETFKKMSSSWPNCNTILERSKKALAMANEKLKIMESKLANMEMQLQEKKTALSKEISELQLAKEETNNIISKLNGVQNRTKSITKEIENMKTQKCLSNKENSNDKLRFDLYRQLTGVTFSVSNPNCPHELKGFAGCAGASPNVKTFSFNTEEHSSSLMSGYIWSVIETVHKKNWETVISDK